ncbi:MAG: L-seryl-tRNA(Sec) selenium transferase [Cetobacterium sp.]
MTQELFRKLPKVDKLLKETTFLELIETEGYPSVYNATSETIQEFRKNISNGLISDFTPDDIFKTIINKIKIKSEFNLKKVINGTGTIIHTNLGRSVFSKKNAAHIAEILTGYSNLEYDLETGKRGSRYSLVEDLICEITGAESALVVNNNAAAVLLCLDEFSKNSEVIVSRGELVEIGGSFRIPDIMSISGSKLVEVGTTNRTHDYDYENAITDNTSLLLKVHTSNYKISGFTKEISREEIVELGKKHNIITMEDLGSGVLVDFSNYGLKKEPTVFDVLKSGMDIITFSGDKLLGGPQCGIIIGKKTLIERLKKNQLLRAFRVCKMTLSSLEVLFHEYYDEKSAVKNIPTLSLILEAPEDVYTRAKSLKSLLNENDIEADIIESFAMIGGGSMPEETIPSFALSFPTFNSVSLERELRTGENPIVGRVQNNCFFLDMKTILKDDFEIILNRLLDVSRG